eukprot:1044485-Prymnesium_polylepis.2
MATQRAAAASPHSRRQRCTGEQRCEREVTRASFGAIHLVRAPPTCGRSPDWQEIAASLAQPDSFDLLVCCDCVYPDRPSGLARVLLDLLALNPSATLLLSCEHRPPPGDAPSGTDHIRDFFAVMRQDCLVERVPDDKLDRRWMCDEISLWTMRLS